MTAVAIPWSCRGSALPNSYRSATSRRGRFRVPAGSAAGSGVTPCVGWSVEWHEHEGAACCTFHVVTSFEQLRPLLNDAFMLLPEQEVFGILELGSRDAYREVDVYLGSRPVARSTFLQTWEVFEPLLLEDASLAVGVNGEGPFVELFVDPDKGLLIHVDPSERDRVEAMLAAHGLSEVEHAGYAPDAAGVERIEVRRILEEHPDLICDMDQLLLELKHHWHLELDEDPTVNLDGRGRRMGARSGMPSSFLNRDRRAGCTRRTPRSGARPNHVMRWSC